MNQLSLSLCKSSLRCLNNKINGQAYLTKSTWIIVCREGQVGLGGLIFTFNEQWQEHLFTKCHTDGLAQYYRNSIDSALRSNLSLKFHGISGIWKAYRQLCCWHLLHFRGMKSYSQSCDIKTSWDPMARYPTAQQIQTLKRQHSL